MIYDLDWNFIEQCHITPANVIYFHAVFKLHLYQVTAMFKSNIQCFLTFAFFLKIRVEIGSKLLNGETILATKMLLLNN